MAGILMMALVLVTNNAFGDNAVINNVVGGSVHYNDYVWATARNAVDGETLVDIQLSVYNRFAGTYYVGREYMNYPISIPVGSEIDSVKINLTSKIAIGVPFYMYLVEGINNTVITLGDFDAFEGRQVSAPHTSTLLADSIQTTGENLEWKLNEDGVMRITDAIADTSRLCILTSSDWSNTPSTSNSFEYYELNLEGSEANMGIWYTPPLAINVRTTLSTGGVVTPFRTESGITPLKRP